MSLRKHRELCLATVFALALTGAAGAADMVVKAPIVVPVPVYSWTGFYIGLGGGTGWGTKEYSFDQDRTEGELIDLFGAYGPALSSHDVNGGFFGGQIGANWQVGWAVFGIQGEWYWSDIEGKGAGHTGVFTDFPFGLGTTASHRAKVKSFGSVTGRLGAAFDRVLLYAKAGVAWEEADHDVTLHGELLGDCLGALVPPFGVGGACNQTQSVSETRTGFTFGTGVELAFDNNWTAFIEYNYYDFDTENFTLNYRFVDFPGVGVTLPKHLEVDQYLHTIKAGINYKFNWWGGPVMARF